MRILISVLFLPLVTHLLVAEEVKLDEKKPLNYNQMVVDHLISSSHQLEKKDTKIDKISDRAGNSIESQSPVKGETPAQDKIFFPPYKFPFWGLPYGIYSNGGFFNPGLFPMVPGGPGFPPFDGIFGGPFGPGEFPGSGPLPFQGAPPKNTTGAYNSSMPYQGNNYYQQPPYQQQQYPQQQYQQQPHLQQQKRAGKKPRRSSRSLLKDLWKEDFTSTTAAPPTIVVVGGGGSQGQGSSYGMYGPSYNYQGQNMYMVKPPGGGGPPMNYGYPPMPQYGPMPPYGYPPTPSYVPYAPPPPYGYGSPYGYNPGYYNYQSYPVDSSTEKPEEESKEKVKSKKGRRKRRKVKKKFYYEPVCNCCCDDDNDCDESYDKGNCNCDESKGNYVPTTTPEPYTTSAPSYSSSTGGYETYPQNYGATEAPNYLETSTNYESEASSNYYETSQFQQYQESPQGSDGSQPSSNHLEEQQDLVGGSRTNQQYGSLAISQYPTYRAPYTRPRYNRLKKRSPSYPYPPVRLPFPNPRPYPPQVPRIPQVPSVPRVPKVPGVPDVPKVPRVPEVPKVPKVPGVPRIPRIPEVQHPPKVPEMQHPPRNPSIPPYPQPQYPPDIPKVQRPPKIQYPPPIQYPQSIPPIQHPPRIPAIQHPPRIPQIQQPQQIPQIQQPPKIPEVQHPPRIPQIQQPPQIPPILQPQQIQQPPQIPPIQYPPRIPSIQYPPPIQHPPNWEPPQEPVLPNIPGAHQERPMSDEDSVVILVPPELAGEIYEQNYQRNNYGGSGADYSDSNNGDNSHDSHSSSGSYQEHSGKDSSYDQEESGSSVSMSYDKPSSHRSSGHHSGYNSGQSNYGEYSLDDQMFSTVNLPMIFPSSYNNPPSGFHVSAYPYSEQGPGVQAGESSYNVQGPGLEAGTSTYNVHGPGLEAGTSSYNVQGPGLEAGAYSYDDNGPGIQADAPKLSVQAPQTEVSPTSYDLHGPSTGVDAPNYSVHGPGMEAGAQSYNDQGPGLEAGAHGPDVQVLPDSSSAPLTMPGSPPDGYQEPYVSIPVYSDEAGPPVISNFNVEEYAVPPAALNAGPILTNHRQRPAYPQIRVPSYAAPISMADYKPVRSGNMPDIYRSVASKRSLKLDDMKSEDERRDGNNQRNLARMDPAGMDSSVLTTFDLEDSRPSNLAYRLGVYSTSNGGPSTSFATVGPKHIMVYASAKSNQTSELHAVRNPVDSSQSEGGKSAVGPHSQPLKVMDVDSSSNQKDGRGLAVGFIEPVEMEDEGDDDDLDRMKRSP